MFGVLREWKENRILRHHPIEESVWRGTLADIPILAGLSPEELERLRRLSALFLHRKAFHPVQGIELTPRMQTLIAAQACLPILHLDFDWYDDWQTVVIYPGKFIRPRREVDDIGVMHEWSEVLSGEAWERGPVILSWADISGSGTGDGYNVILHEMAHKLDMRNGGADGFPPLHRGMRVRDWSRMFRAAYDELNRALDDGEWTPVDPYAAESPAEFFAVFSEYFFELPHRVESAYPDIYRLLREFYRQDPARRRGSIGRPGTSHEPGSRQERM